MTIKQQIRKQPSKAVAAAISAAPTVVSLVSEFATVMAPRRRQFLAAVSEGADLVYVVRSGVVALQSMLPGEGRPILELLFPGDIFRAAMAPPLGNTGLLALGTAELLRVRADVFDAKLSSNQVLADLVCRQIANQHARMVLHVTTVGYLPSEQRLAAFLVKIALKIGQQSPNGIAFELPMSRSDVAAYLALNPDTLSRIVSRWKHNGLLDQTGRSRMTVRNLAELKRECRIGDPLERLYSASAAA